MFNNFFVNIISVLCVCFLSSLGYTQGDNKCDPLINLGCLAEATVTGSLPDGVGRGIPTDILWDPATGAYKTPSQWHEYGLAYHETVGGVTKDNPLWWQVTWPTAKNINYITCTGSYPNQPQKTTGWSVQIKVDGVWQDLAKAHNGWDADVLSGAGIGISTQTSWLWDGQFVWRGLEPVVTRGIRFTAYANPDSLADGVDSFADSLWSFIWSGRQLGPGQPKAVLIQYLDFSNEAADNELDEMVNLALLDEAVVSASFVESTYENERGQPVDILYDPVKDDYHNKNTAWCEFGFGYGYDAGFVEEENPFYWMVEWPVPKNINFFTWGGVYNNQPQPNTPWAVQYWDGNAWETLIAGIGGSWEDGDKTWPYTPGISSNAQSIWMVPEADAITTNKIRLAAWSDGITPLWSFHIRGRGGACMSVDDTENPFKAVLVQYKHVVLDTGATTISQSEKPDFSHKRGFYSEPFYLTLTTEQQNTYIRYTTDCSKPSRDFGTIYSEPIYIDKIAAIRAVAYHDTTLCSEVRTHSFIFPANVLTQDDSGLPVEEHSRDHVFWTEEFDMNDVNQSEQEMIEALLDIPTMYVSAPYDSIFGIAGIHRGQNLEEYGGDPHHPDWKELVECSVEMIYPENYRNDRFENWQENCGIKIQGGAGRWNNGSFDHKQSFTLEFKKKYGAGMLKNDYLVSAPYNSESSPEEFDKIIIRTGFNRDWGSEWDRANCAYTRDQFARDLQILMSGWGCHGTYAHLYINGKYWGQYNPCERMDNHALATYFGGESDDYFYGKGKGGVKFGSPDRYNYINNTNWTNRQLSEIEEYLAVDTYIDVAIVHCYANVGDGPQYYFGSGTNPYSPIYYTAWDMEDSFDGGGRRTGPPVSMENYNMPYSGDKFEAYFKMKNNIDFKMKFTDRVYKHCFNDGILTNDRVTAVWDSSCNVISKSILCEIARWGDERGRVYDYEHWKNECKDVRDDLIGRAELFVNELKKSGMYPKIDPPALKDGDEIILTDTYNCPENFSLNIAFLWPQPGEIFYTTDGTDPRTWDLTGNISPNAIKVTGIDTTLSITQVTTVKARVKNSGTWSPLRELKIIPEKSSSVVINEINYDSSPTFDTEDWVEIYNNSETDIPLAGWKLKDSDDNHIFNFSQNMILKSNSYLVVCRDTSDFKAFFEDVDNYIGNIDFKFGNDGDIVRIFSSTDMLIDSVQYDNEAPWPLMAAGKGATLELINPDYDNTQVENWRALKLFGTPGRSNSNSSDTAIIRDRETQNRPSTFTLSQNYPNPFNLTTHIKYNITTAGLVTLRIFNMAGQEVKTLVNDYQNPGVHSVNWTAEGIASGIYLYQLKTKDFSAAKKLIVTK